MGTGGTVEADKPACSASRTRQLQVPLSDHDEKENLLTSMAKNDVAVPRQAIIEKTKSKKYILTGDSTMRKDDITAVKPYRQILERYTLGSKKSNRRQPERQTSEMATPPAIFARRTAQQEGNQSHSQIGVVANDNDQRGRERDNQHAVLAPDRRRKMASIVTYHEASDLQVERRNQDLPEVKRVAETSFGSPRRFVSNNNEVSSVAATSPWKSNAETSFSASVSKKSEDSSALMSLNWRSQSNLFEQTYWSYLQPASSPFSYPEPAAAAVKNDKSVETRYPYQRSSVSVVFGCSWKLRFG